MLESDARAALRYRDIDPEGMTRDVVYARLEALDKWGVGSAIDGSQGS